ncbi:hypothetical protein T484DRAFT_2542498 [Baffinella frigidus]|nr:hypothetical protein T484DRAFT_2542498 [Cryptophyta sp. CCMP2293]
MPKMAGIYLANTEPLRPHVRAPATPIHPPHSIGIACGARAPQTAPADCNQCHWRGSWATRQNRVSRVPLEGLKKTAQAGSPTVPGVISHADANGFPASGASQRAA